MQLLHHFLKGGCLFSTSSSSPFLKRWLVKQNHGFRYEEHSMKGKMRRIERREVGWGEGSVGKVLDTECEDPSLIPRGHLKPDVVVHTCSASSWETKTRETLKLDKSANNRDHCLKQGDTRGCSLPSTC